MAAVLDVAMGEGTPIRAFTQATTDSKPRAALRTRPVRVGERVMVLMILDKNCDVPLLIIYAMALLIEPS